MDCVGKELAALGDYIFELACISVSVCEMDDAVTRIILQLCN